MMCSGTEVGGTMFATGRGATGGGTFGAITGCRIGGGATLGSSAIFFPARGSIAVCAVLASCNDDERVKRRRQRYVEETRRMIEAATRMLKATDFVNRSRSRCVPR